jgi:transposase
VTNYSGVLEHYVTEAHAAKDWSQVRRLMIDETGARKGHRYVTVVLDAESHDLCSWSKGAVPRP